MKQARATAKKLPSVKTTKDAAAAKSAGKGRMVHVRLDPELHRKIRVVVATQDTTLQEWIARTLEDAAEKAWPDVARGAGR